VCDLVVVVALLEGGSRGPVVQDGRATATTARTMAERMDRFIIGELLAKRGDGLRKLQAINALQAPRSATESSPQEIAPAITAGG